MAIFCYVIGKLKNFMEKETIPKKIIRVCKKCNNTYMIDYENVLFYKSIKSELFEYCQGCRLVPKVKITEKKDWCHNDLK